MKKLILILLFSITLFNFTDGVFASARKPTIEGAFNGMKKGFGFLVKTRDESVLKPETIQKRREMEKLIVRTYREGHRDLLMQAFEEEVEGFKNTYNEHKKNKDGKEQLSLDCLKELSRIKALMVSGK